MNSGQALGSQRTLMLGESDEHAGHEQPSTVPECNLRLDSMETLHHSPNKLGDECRDVEVKALVKGMIFDGLSPTPPSTLASAVKWMEMYIAFNFEPAKVVQEFSGRVSQPRMLNTQACKSSDLVLEASGLVKELSALELKRNSGVAGILDAVRKKQALADESPSLTPARKVAVKKSLEDWGSSKLKMMDGFIAKQKELTFRKVEEACDEVLQLFNMIDCNQQGEFEQTMDEPDFIKELEHQLQDLDLGLDIEEPAALEKPLEKPPMAPQKAGRLLKLFHL